MASASAARALPVALSLALLGACASGGSGSDLRADLPVDSGLVDAPSGDLPADPGPADSADVGEADASDGLEVAPEVDGTPEVDAGPDGGGPLVCVPEALGEVKRLELPEASGAVWIDNALGRGWLVIADSGNKGAGALLDPVAYLTLPVEFPLDAAAGDDVEGLALSPLGRVVGLVSSGYIREWTADATGLVLAQFATAVTDDADYLCDPQGGNCAANFEGFCLHPAPGPDAACVGFAVSKARGELVCVVSTDDGYRLDPSQRLAVGEAEQLSGCDYELEAPHRLVVAGNLFALSALWEVRGYDDLATAEVLSMPLTGAANQEALGFGPGGLLISFGDTQGLNGSETSPMVGFRCK